ncbi:MAG: amidohydrolase family protein [Opitutaceae bacterium]
MIIDCHNHLGADDELFRSGALPYGQDLLTMTSIGRAGGVTNWIVFPFVHYRGQPGTLLPPPPGELAAPFAWENLRLAGELRHQLPEQGRDCLQFAMLDPARNTDLQIAALRRLRDQYPIAGLKIQATVIKSPIGALHDVGSCFVDLAAEWDIPFIIHTSVIDNDPWSQADEIAGIAESRPDVRFCLAHSCRFDRSVLDRIAGLANAWFDCSAHLIHCQSVVRELPIVAPPGRRFKSDYRDPVRVLADLAAAYPGKLIWGSDSPAYLWIEPAGSALPSLIATYQEETACLRALPEAVIREIAAKNTMNWLGTAEGSFPTTGSVS